MNPGALKVSRVLFAVAALFTVPLVASLLLIQSVADFTDNQLESQLVAAAQWLRASPPTAVPRTDSPWRVSLLDGNGKVLSDSLIGSGTLVEQDAQPELEEALRKPIGTARRYSSVAGATMVFVAAKLPPSASPVVFLRLSAGLGDGQSPWRFTLAIGLVVQLLTLLGFGGFLWWRSRTSATKLKTLLATGAAFARGENPDRLFLSGQAPWPFVSTALNRMYDQMDSRFQALNQERNELAAILAGMVEAVIVLDTQFLIKALNPTARRLFPTARAPEGQSLIEVTRNSALDDLARELASTGVDSLRGEVLLSDLETTFQVQGALLRGPGGPIFGSVLVMSDITQLKRLEMMRRDFVANVSHELKTPITNIKGYVETLLEGTVPADKAIQFLSVIDRHALRLSMIVDDLLILTRLENSPPEEGELRVVRLGELVEGIVTQASPRAVAKKIRLDAKLPPMDLELTAFPLLLEQAIINLVDNAIKFCPEGSRIRILVSAASEIVTLEVRDDGPGIPEREQQRVFERFYRATQGRTKEGTGLGLSIVKHIVHIHRGTVVLASPPPGESRGTSFTLNLPYGASGR